MFERPADTKYGKLRSSWNKVARLHLLKVLARAALAEPSRGEGYLVVSRLQERLIFRIEKFKRPKIKDKGADVEEKDDRLGTSCL